MLTPTVDPTAIPAFAPAEKDSISGSGVEEAKGLGWSIVVFVLIMPE